MEADGVLPDPDKPVPAEIVHESGRTRITRLVVPVGTIIRKEPLGPDGERRVRHEVAMLERLGGVAGVAQLAGTPRYPGSVVLANAGGASLAWIAKPLAADELAGLAVGLGRAVAGMHRQGVIHRDITPANIVVADDGSPCLVDFALASSFAEIRPEFTPHAEITGTLAYLAPEATGRTGRPVDQRADLYALGAVLYELASGEPPFGTGDPLQLIHDHLARVPVPPVRVNPAVPAALSEIIMHLLEKEPDNRYQTADGLVYDLERAQADPGAAGFGVGEHDVPVRLLPEQYLPAVGDAAASAGEQSGDLTQRHGAVTAGTVDLLGILSASQALSSETSVGRLHARVVEVLSAMTGATGVHLLLWDAGRQDWLLPASDAGGGNVAVSGTRQEGAAAVSVLSYVQRTREPLVVADAVRDDRFARDPYFAGVACCSLLAVPILSRGALRAVLVLENRLIRAAFTTGRLDAVNLIAGQLAVSLDNAQVYAEFGQIADEQAALRRVATLVANGAAPEQVFAAVTEEMAGLLSVDLAGMAHYDPDGTLTCVSSWGKAVDYVPVGSRWDGEGKNIATAVFETGRSARVESHADGTGSLADAVRKMGMRSSVATPIIVEGRVWGVMGAGSTREEPLPLDAEARLASFTELVATAIANAESRAALARVADEQAALRRVAMLVARAAPPEGAFAAVTAEAGRLLSADVAILSRYDADGTQMVLGTWADTGGQSAAVGTRVALRGQNLATLVFHTAQPARIDDYADASGPGVYFARKSGLGAGVGVPINVEGRLWGVMTVASAREPLPAGTEVRLARFTELAATAIANAQARAEVSASRARIVAASDETRRRIERDLHDGVQQRLVTQALMLSGIRDRVPADVRADLDEVRDDLAATRQELRDVCQGVHPAILVEAGLGAAIRALARRSPLPVRVQLRAGGRFPGSCEVTAYYVAAEAFTNAAKYANASAVDILIEAADGTLTVQVRDDGVGGADASRGSGLTGLRDRVEAVGGSMTLDSPAGAGTVLTALLPVTADDH
jgi:signal transduction histidine kinase